MIQLASEISALLAELRRLNGVESAYLIGSQACGKETATSDWDILLFGTESTVRQVQTMWPACPHLKLDLLIVYDGDNFRSPWLEEGRKQPKSGSLTTWDWREDTNRQGATYEQKKPVKGTPHINISDTRAVLLFREEQQ